MHHLTILFAVFLALTAACQPEPNPGSWEPVARDPVAELDDQGADEPIQTGTRHRDPAPAPGAEGSLDQAVPGTYATIEDPAPCSDYSLEVLDEARVAPGTTVELAILTAGRRPVRIDLAGLELAAAAPFELSWVSGLVELQPGESLVIASAALPAGWSTDADVLPTAIARVLGHTATLTATPWRWDARATWRSICD